MILLTGASGFLGSYFLIKLLSENREVKAIMRKTSNFEQIKFACEFLSATDNQIIHFEKIKKQVVWVEADISELESLKNQMNGISEIFHLAASVSFHKDDRYRISHSNLQGTSNLVNLALKYGVEKFHYVSSIASLNRNSNDLISEEDISPINKKSSYYSKSKYFSEMEIWRGYAEGLGGIIINPGVIVGAAIDTHEISRIFKMIKKGFDYYPKGSNGYVDVRDVAEMLWLLSRDKNCFGNRFLLVSESVSYKELFSEISSCFGVQPPSKEVNKALSYILAFLDQGRALLTGKKPVLTNELVGLVNNNYQFDNSKIRNTLGKEFIPVKKSIADTCHFLKEIWNSD